MGYSDKLSLTGECSQLQCGSCYLLLMYGTKDKEGEAKNVPFEITKLRTKQNELIYFLEETFHLQCSSGFCTSQW